MFHGKRFFHNLKSESIIKINNTHTYKHVEIAVTFTVTIGTLDHFHILYSLDEVQVTKKISQKMSNSKV